MLRSREMKASLLAVLVMGLLNTSMFAAERNTPKFTPTIDGTVSASEIAGQLAISISAFTVVPVTGNNIVDATAYLSWNDEGINFSAIVADNTPNYDAPGGNVGIFTTQDVVQAFFNPNNDHGGFGTWYDMSGDTAGGAGADIYRRSTAGGGLPFTDAEYDGLKNKTDGGIDGSTSANGYHVEATIPWAVAMHAMESGYNYTPSVGDEHGIGFFVISENSSNAHTGFLGSCNCFLHNDLNTIILNAPDFSPYDFNSDGMSNFLDINEMSMQGNLADNSTTVGATDNKFDLVDNDIIDSADVSEGLSGAATENGFGTPYRRGDTELDRDVDITDFNALAANFLPAATATSHLNGAWHLGNFDGDGDIDITDFNSLSGNFSPSGYSDGEAHQIPEPGTITMLVLGFFACMAWKRRGVRIL